MNDDLLRTSIDDAVHDVEPTDRLFAIRTATRRRQARRRTRWVVGSASLAAASVAALALLVGLADPPRAVDPAGPDPTGPVQTYTVFYVGPGPDGPDAPLHPLYRETAEARGLAEALTRTPSDPDYRTLWPVGSLGEVVVSGDEIEAVLMDPELRERVDGVSDDEARAAIQQVVHTAQVALETDAPVRFVLDDGSEVDSIYGRSVDLSGRAPALTVLSHMSISSPSEGTVISSAAGALAVSGRGNSFEASGTCFLADDAGEVVGERGLAQMDGWTGQRLYPFALELDLTDVPGGTYVLTCVTDDASGGTEGRGTDSDTRTVIVE